MSEPPRSGSRLRNQNAKVLAAVAARQSGRVSWAQLEGMGIRKSAIARWVKQGYLQRSLPGVYAVGHTAPSTEADLAAALLYAGSGAMLSHATAAWWLGLVDREPAVIDVTAPRRRRSVPGVRVHARRPRERIWHNWLPVVSAAETLLDFASTATIDRVRRALAEAEFRRLIDIAPVEMVLGRGQPGSATLRKAIRAHQPRLALTRSRLEEAFVAPCESGRIPLPQVNAIVVGLTVDAVWRERRVVVELDGHDGHRTAAQIARDRGRELRLRAAGFLVIRYTWDQITNEAALVVADLLRVLREGDNEA